MCGGDAFSVPFILSWTASKQVWLWFAEPRGGDTQALPRIFRLCWIPKKSVLNQATQKKYLPKFPTPKNPGIENFYYPRHLRSGVRPLPPGPGFLKISLLRRQKILYSNDLFVSILKVETDAGINIPGYVLSQIKGKYKNVNIPPNIATRANTRGPFLFQCCRVVLNKETNRLELPKGEVVGKTVRSKEEEKEDEYENTAVSLVEDKESNLMGKISICFPLNHSGLLEANSVIRVIPIFSRIW